MKILLPAFFVVLAVRLFAATVTLEWDHSPDPTVTGYRLYGRTGEVYTMSWTAPRRTNAITASNLLSLVTYRFVVVATNVFNIESLPSNEVSVTHGGPSTPKAVSIIGR